MQKRAKDQMVTFTLRIPEGLRARIEVAARKSGTSINSEMERRLAQSFDETKRREELTTFMWDYMTYAIEHGRPDDETIEWMRQRLAQRERK